VRAVRAVRVMRSVRSVWAVRALRAVRAVRAARAVRAVRVVRKESAGRAFPKLEASLGGNHLRNVQKNVTFPHDAFNIVRPQLASWKCPRDTHRRTMHDNRFYKTGFGELIFRRQFLKTRPIFENRFSKTKGAVPPSVLPSVLAQFLQKPQGNPQFCVVFPSFLVVLGLPRNWEKPVL
jgi:hypothetical protein